LVALFLFEDQGRGVAAPHSAFISLHAQRNEAKKCARLLALRVPSTAAIQGALAKLACGTNIPRFITLNHFRFGCVTRGEMDQSHEVELSPPLTPPE